MREVLVKAVNEDYGDALDALASNGLPVAMVWGEHDTAATTAMAERARARIGAHADLVVVPGSAHLLDEALVAALRSGDRRPGSATMSATANVLVGLAISLLALASYLRWWRVAQREHYEPGRLVAMAAIWCRAQPANVLALAAVVALCLVGLKLPLVGLVGAAGLAAVAARPGAAAPEQEARVDRARAPARGDHRRAARGGHRLLPGLRRGGRAGAAAGAADRRGRAARRAPAGGPPQPALRSLGRREDQAGRAAGGGDHRVLRQDLDQELRRAPDGRPLVGAGEPGELQQRAGAGPCGQRPAHSGDRRVHRRDGHLRARRDRPAVPAVPARGLRDHHDRRGAPGADEGPRHDRARQVRDPRAGQHHRAERRRARAGRGRRIGTPPRSG